MIEIFPAIDLHNGQAVRLKQGDYNQVEVFFKNPVEVLDFFNKNNSKNLHIVDLDGAKDGNTKNYEVIKELVEKSDFFVQVGGGIRDEERIKEYIELGVNRIILGTIAVENEEFLREMVKKYGAKIAVSVDSKNEKVAVKGWTETVELLSIIVPTSISIPYFTFSSNGTSEISPRQYKYPHNTRRHSELS